jgi:hypothetical protein
MQAFAAALDLDQATTDVAAIVNTLGAEPVKRWEGFDEVDEATLALRQLIPGENKDIAVVRVSPRDGTSVCDERHGSETGGHRDPSLRWVLPTGLAAQRHHVGSPTRPSVIGMPDDAADATIDKTVRTARAKRSSPISSRTQSAPST